MRKEELKELNCRVFENADSIIENIPIVVESFKNGMVNASFNLDYIALIDEDNTDYFVKRNITYSYVIPSKNLEMEGERDIIKRIRKHFKKVFEKYDYVVPWEDIKKATESE